MPQVINTNVASMFAQAKLGAAQKDANVALERLSTGLRINSAKDDAAGLSISSRLTTQISVNEPGHSKCKRWCFSRRPLKGF